jgi:hypothetical protein
MQASKKEGLHHHHHHENDGDGGTGSHMVWYGYI